MWLRLKISWLINLLTLSKKSLLLGLSAWRKVLFSWWARILPRKLSLIRAEKWKRRPLLHQESDLFPTLTLAPPYWRTEQFSLGGCRKSQGHGYERWSMKNHGYERRQHIKESIKKPRPERGGERVFLGFQGAGKLALAETKQFENFPDYSNAQLRIVIWWSGVKPKYCLSKCCLESCHPIYHPSSRTKSCIKFTICSLFKFCTQCKFYIKESIGWLVLEWPTLHLELCILQWSYFEDLSNQGTCNLIYTNSTANCK